jgi:hypothetical protein
VGIKLDEAIGLKLGIFVVREMARMRCACVSALPAVFQHGP